MLSKGARSKPVLESIETAEILFENGAILDVRDDRGMTLIALVLRTWLHEEQYW